MKRFCPTLAYKKTHVNWDEPKEFNSLKSLTPKVKTKKIKLILSYLLNLPTYLVPPTYLNIDF